MSRRKRISKESADICARVYAELAKVRQERDLSNIIFAFPRVKCQGTWQASGALIAASIAKRNQIPGSNANVRAFPITLVGVDDVEVFVDHYWMKKLRELGCLTVEKSKPNARVKVPSEIADRTRIPTTGIADVPPFQHGATWSWPMIEAMQRVSSNISGGKGLSWPVANDQG